VNAVLSGNDGERDASFIKRFVELTAADGSTTSPNKDGFDREELLFTLRDLFGGGRETVSDTLGWALMELANYPDGLIRMRKELDEVIGTDRLPSLDDKSRMPYTQAVILETLRRHPVVPLALFHSTMSDSYIGDYFIPKDTIVRFDAVNDCMISKKIVVKCFF
jgi:cytochrome P450